YLAANYSEEKTHSCELKGIHKNKTILDLELFGTITTINEQEAILGTLIDISERKKSERRLVEAQEAAKVGSWETDLSNLQVKWSDETFAIFDLDKNEFNPTHNSFLEIVHPEDKVKVDDAFKSSFNTKEYNTVEHRILTKKGNLKYVEERWKVSFNSSDEPVRVFGTCQDISQRKQVELELMSTKLAAQDNTYRLSLAAESANLGIWDWNILEDTLLWDDKSYEIHGVKKGLESNVFATWSNRLHPDDKERAIHEVNAALKGEANYNTIFKIIKPSGEIAHIKADGKVLYNNAGVAYRMIGFINDITESVQFEEKLTQSEERQRALIENISDGIVLVDKSYSVIYQSPAVEKIVGYTIADRKGKKAVDFVHPEDTFKSIEQFNLAYENPGKPFQSLNRTRHKNGNYIWIEVSVTNLLKLSSVQAFVVVYRDITERKLFEEKLALSSLILNSSHDAIMSISLEGIITSWNKGAEKILGYTYEEALGQSIYMLIPPELHDEEINISASIKEKKIIDRYETVRIKKDGTIVDVSLTVSPILNELNHVIGASKIMRDISAQKVSEYEKAQMMNDLIQRNKDLEQFAYIVSHNLRAP
ncbi:MAG: PAS domain S-box protein, partial [Sediminibacterium sp.]|nr:PAS domain S-box protein [Sediminibacterium sp.]